MGNSSKILGSSPRVWGQVFENGKFFKNFRIIPTRVGTRSGYFNLLFAQKDHPHACGDKFQREFPDVKSAGSSPRVWGQVGSIHLDGIALRSIPTRVGTRKAVTVTITPTRDHPHACGDKVFPLERGERIIGSSPRVWGQVLAHFIPP